MCFGLNIKQPVASFFKNNNCCFPDQRKNLSFSSNSLKPIFMRIFAAAKLFLLFIATRNVFFFLLFTINFKFTLEDTMLSMISKRHDLLALPCPSFFSDHFYIFIGPNSSSLAFEAILSPITYAAFISPKMAVTIQEQSLKGFFVKRYSENMHHIKRNTPMQKCDFNSNFIKITLLLAALL